MFVQRPSFIERISLWAVSAAPFVTGQIVVLERPSSVYVSPSGKSKILADADRGTALVVKSVSPKGTWLELEDEEGNRGWIPANRTDWSKVSAHAVKPADGAPNMNLEKKTDEDSLARETKAVTDPDWLDWSVGLWRRDRILHQGDPVKAPSHGVQAGYLVAGPRGDRYGLQVGFGLSAMSELLIPLRCLLVSPWGKGFSGSPHLGLTIFRTQSGPPKKWLGSGEFGYHVYWGWSGWSLFAGPEFVWGHKTRLMSEIGITKEF
jgi:hypothetical protein